MVSNFIGGGQVFLHKIRMLRQVVSTTVLVALISGCALAISLNKHNTEKVDWDGAITFAKAKWIQAIHPALSIIAIKKSKARVDAYSKGRLWKRNMLAKSVLTSNRFSSAQEKARDVVQLILLQAVGLGFAAGLIVFLLWSKFGKNLKKDKRKSGSGSVLTSSEVKSTLRKLGAASEFTIGKMPLVKDMETRHFLVSGSTGSGKTNLIHNLLPQVESRNQPAIVIDQTGEMIAKYYNKERGDIIFNPFDARSKSWDLWADCSTRIDLERFSKILIGFNRKQSGSHSDPFWENSAEAVFNACAEYCRANNSSIAELVNMTCHVDINQLQAKLRGSKAERFLNTDSKQTAASIVSVLSSNAKPLTYLHEAGDAGSFSMKEHFANIKDGSSAWLFLATKPSSRALTLPLIACLTELALAQVMEIGIDKNRRIWTIIDELASLGKLPALTPLMAEGRKYGVCVLAGLQSLNQLYSHYGHYDGSTIFGQFGTSFFFRNTEPAIAKMISSMCGSETVTRQQKNTSFGANTFRDGVSYNEQQQKKALVEPDDLASLSIGECYTLLPEPAVRVSKMQTPEATLTDKNAGFIEQKELDKAPDAIGQDEDLAIENFEYLSPASPPVMAPKEQKKKPLAEEVTHDQSADEKVINPTNNKEMDSPGL